MLVGSPKTLCIKQKIVKRIGNIYDKISSIENLELADSRARRGKLKSYGVQKHSLIQAENLKKLHTILKDCKYKTSSYDIFKIYEPKEREIYRLPYYPDRIVHHALMNYLESIWVSVFIKDTYACVKNRGIHSAAKKLKSQLRNNKEATKYCLKLDIKKFYPSIDQSILKVIIRRKIKDAKVLLILDEIISSVPNGVPIGNYLSQFFANLYLAYFDHWLKEVHKVKFYYRYADDIVILSSDKAYLHSLRKVIDQYVTVKLNLKIKGNWQVFPVDKRGIDFLGYVFFSTHTLIRKSIKRKFCKVYFRMLSKNASEEYIQRRVCSWLGWMKHCNSKNLMNNILKFNMKANSVFNKPTVLENRGDGTYFYNYNIIESTKQVDDLPETVSYDYDQVIIYGEPTYSKIVSSIIRSDYSSSNEIALINNYHRYLIDGTLVKYYDEYIEYLNYVSTIKSIVKQDCLTYSIVID